MTDAGWLRQASGGKTQLLCSFSHENGCFPTVPTGEQVRIEQKLQSQPPDVFAGCCRRGREPGACGLCHACASGQRQAVTAAPIPEKSQIIYWSMFGLEEAKQAQSPGRPFRARRPARMPISCRLAGAISSKRFRWRLRGNPPDMVTLWSQPYTWGPRGLLQPLEGYAERDGFDGTGWSPAAWDALWSDGHLWGTGHTLNVFALHIDQSAYEEAALQRRCPSQNLCRPGSVGGSLDPVRRRRQPEPARLPPCATRRFSTGPGPTGPPSTM
jgi:hypothetical protein